MVINLHLTIMQLQVRNQKQQILFVIQFQLLIVSHLIVQIKISKRSIEIKNNMLSKILHTRYKNKNRSKSKKIMGKK